MKTICVKEKNWKKIKQIQLNMSLKTINDAIEHILFEYLRLESGEY